MGIEAERLGSLSVIERKKGRQKGVWDGIGMGKICCIEWHGMGLARIPSPFVVAFIWSIRWAMKQCPI